MSRNLLPWRLALLLSTAMVVPGALADDFTISSPVTVQNGGNVIDGNDRLTILPSGSITVTGTDAVSATGIQNVFDIRGGIVANGAFANGMSFGSSNTIDISGSVVTNGFAADGLFGGSDNRISVSGLLSTTDDSAYNINVFDRNTITISGMASTTGDFSHAISVFDHNTITINGDVSTSGRIADGVNLVDHNTVTINGSVTATGFLSDGVFGGDRNMVTNFGTVMVSGSEGEGILLNDFSTAINRGTIVTYGEEGDAIDLNDFGTAENTGRIETFGANADGLDVDDDSTATNTGYIIVHGPASTGGFLPSAFDGDDRNTFTNSGYIVSVQGNSIDFGGTGNTLNLMAPSFIGGRMVLGTGTTVNITTGRSHSVLWDFSTGTMTGGMPAIGGPVPYFWNNATKQFATFDPSSLAASPDVLAQLTGGISRIIRHRLGQGGYGYPQPNGTTPLPFHNTFGNGASRALDGQTDAEPHHRGWVDGFGEFGRYGETGIFNSTKQQHYGVLAGADAMVLPDMTLGFMVGYVGGRQKVDTFWDITSQEVDTHGLVAGIYGRGYVDHTHVDFAVTGGWQRHDSTRFVNNNLAPLGVDHAGADYNSGFVSPEVTVSRDIAMDDLWTFRPSATGRYAAQWFGGYSETGSPANAKVASRLVQVAEGRLELAVSHTRDRNRVTLRAGVLGRTSFGSGDADITLIGSTVSIPGARSNGHFAGFAGGDADFAIGPDWIGTISANAQFGQNNINVFSGRIGATKRF